MLFSFLFTMSTGKVSGRGGGSFERPPQTHHVRRSASSVLRIKQNWIVRTIVQYPFRCVSHIYIVHTYSPGAIFSSRIPCQQNWQRIFSDTFPAFHLPAIHLFAVCRLIDHHATTAQCSCVYIVQTAIRGILRRLSPDRPPCNNSSCVYIVQTDIPGLLRRSTRPYRTVDSEYGRSSGSRLTVRSGRDRHAAPQQPAVSG